MEDTSSISQSSSQVPSSVIGLMIVGVLAVAAIGVLVYEKQSSAVNSGVQTQVVDSSTTSETNLGAAQVDHAYQDGEYTVMGAYTSPGGPEEIEVTLTLENGVITDSEVVPQATLPISQEKQAAFTAEYKTLVVGKNIDEVELTKVAGASLTPKGFNDALQKIKQEAQS